MSDATAIEAALTPLVGLPLWRSHGAAGMQAFTFGAKVTRMARFGPHKGSMVEAGEYAVHVQCPWCVVAANGRIVASDLDRAPLVQWPPQPLVVERVTVTHQLGFRLDLADDHALIVVPDTDEAEQWRLLRRDDRHFVITHVGIER
jgi:hypothetical protein